MFNAEAPTRIKLKSFLANARSIHNKYFDFEEILCTENSDIIAITESWLNIERRDILAELKVLGCTVFEKSRKNKK